MIAIIQYNAGNVASVANAVRRLGYEVEITADPLRLQAADKVIFPGVGQASSAMRYLKQTGLDQTILALRQPVLGICLGMQLLCAYSEEGNVEGLGVFPQRVRRFPSNGIVPHMGWNTVRFQSNPLTVDSCPEADFYFVHSYYAELNEYTVGTCHYLVEFSAVLQRDNFYATQFHPEKSAKIGQQLLVNFLAL